MPNRSLAPYPLDRLRRLLAARGWPRSLAIRRAVAAALALLAVILALLPGTARGESGQPMLVAAGDLRAGTTLTAGHLRTVDAPTGLRPAAALSTVDSAVGRVLAGAAGAGEPITSARLVGQESTRLHGAGADTAAVPVRLADPAVADLLRPGSRVDVVAGDRADKPGTVLAREAVVVTVHSGPDRVSPGEKGRLVLLALPRDTATQVASVSLGRSVTVTLR
ncbi:Flp pilus assembly protein CpaB [Herbihabitans rhizosphaerae]|uniref:Flp pilus assembly protein CpaB n=1 Tax=Herbihabitans rhizosphaerae TaxID=1872711 RepID=A0A4Q7KW73_9PSEU|nr:SAF domain-containing protein [Herbihabitans rhizosphaerae]RZS40897.1 Flp pilus assembly protein CpaB [Herbihabitans rhizosphaerae]